METLSVAEFKALYERETGKPSPSLEHARFEKKLVRALEQTLGEEHEVLAELTLALPNGNVVPDVSIFCLVDLPASHHEAEHSAVKVMPLVAIEILTRSQPLSEVTRKTEAYLRAGIKSCWMLSLGMECVFVYSARINIFSSTAKTCCATPPRALSWS